MPGSRSWGGGPTRLVPGLCSEKFGEEEKPGGVIVDSEVVLGAAWQGNWEQVRLEQLFDLHLVATKKWPTLQGDWERVGSQIRGGQVVQLLAVEVVISLGF